MEERLTTQRRCAPTFGLPCLRDRSQSERRTAGGTERLAPLDASGARRETPGAISGSVTLLVDEALGAVLSAALAARCSATPAPPCGRPEPSTTPARGCSRFRLARVFDQAPKEGEVPRGLVDLLAALSVHRTQSEQPSEQGRCAGRSSNADSGGLNAERGRPVPASGPTSSLLVAPAVL